MRRHLPHPIQDRLPRTGLDREQPLQACLLPGIGKSGEHAVEPFVGALGTLVTSRDRTVGPGNNTFLSTSQAVAKSKSTPGRSAESHALP